MESIEHIRAEEEETQRGVTVLNNPTMCDTSNCCEDCPDVNDNPPAKSECPYFDTSPGFAVCERPDGMESRLKDFIGGTGFIEDAVGVVPVDVLPTTRS